jgi:hypothetical protein
MIERYLSWSAIGSAGLFAILGILAVATSSAENAAASGYLMLAAIVVLAISILLAVGILIYAALPKPPPD